MASYRRNYEPRTVRRIIVIAGAVAVAAACAAGGVSAHAGTSPDQLVYICQQAPCANAQELAVFDGNGAPIMAVGEYGGLGVFGDLISVTGGPDRVTRVNGNVVFWPSVVTGYQSPAAYFMAHLGAIWAVRCKVPARWDEPGGTWVCAAGRWVLRIRL